MSRWRSLNAPWPCFSQNAPSPARLPAFFRAVEGAVETAEKPFQPGRDIEVAFLGRFENVVIVASLQPDLRGHAVEALRLFSERASAMSAMARAMRPLPSSNGWMVTNHRCASPALSTGSMPSRR